MSACPTLCRKVQVLHSRATVCPSAPSIRSGWPDPIKKNIVHSSYGPSPPAPTIPLEPFRASPEPSITIPRQPKSTFDWSKVEFRTRPLSRLDPFKFRVLSIHSHRRRPALRRRQSKIIDLAFEWLPHFAQSPCPHQVRPPWSAFSQFTIRISFRPEFCCCCWTIIVNHIPPLPEPTGRRQTRVTHCV